MTPTIDAAADLQRANKATATKFIHGFNDDDWDAVREVVAPGFVFHHPLGGTVEAGPEGMVSTWAGFKQLSPDSWHPIPIMIADGDYVAVLLPTYGTFTGQGEHAPPPTGGRLDYGMVNIARLADGKLAEMWFGMDSLAEMQQMGVAPPAEPRHVDPRSAATLDAFNRTDEIKAGEFDTVTAFGDVVVTIGPPQASKESSNRRIEMYRVADGRAVDVYHHEMVTSPPHDGGSTVDTNAARQLIERWIADVVDDHDETQIENLVSDHLLIHPTAMPSEAAYHGPAGARHWLTTQWTAFADLAVVSHTSVAHGDIAAVRWTAQGTSTGSFMAVPSTGKAIVFTGVTMFRVEGDKIAEIWDTRNTLGILHQLNPELGAGGHHH
jgi:steroid delta-isomerase-like uncharacterized protein